MDMPFLNAGESTPETTDSFGGYQHKARISDSEFYDMRNLTCDDYPLGATRGPRGLMPIYKTRTFSSESSYTDTNISFTGNDRVIAAVGKEEIYISYVRFTHNVKYTATFHVARYDTDTGLLSHDTVCGSKDFDTEAEATAFADSQQFIKMGAYLVIYPLKTVINTMKTYDEEEPEYGADTKTEWDKASLAFFFEPMEKEVTEINLFGFVVDFNGDIQTINRIANTDRPKPVTEAYFEAHKPITVNGISYSEYNAYKRAFNEYHEPNTGDIWIDTNEKPAAAKKYSAELGIWAAAALYLPLAFDGDEVSYGTRNLFPVTGDAKKKYKAEDTGKYYRWADEMSWKKYEEVPEAAFKEGDAITIDSLPEFVDKLESQKYFVVTKSGPWLTIPINIKEQPSVKYNKIGLYDIIIDDEGNTVTADSINSVEPDSPTDGYVWIDTSVNPSVAKKWSASEAEWTEFDIYLPIAFTGTSTESYAGTSLFPTPGDATVLYKDTSSGLTVKPKYRWDEGSTEYKQIRYNSEGRSSSVDKDSPIFNVGDRLIIDTFPNYVDRNDIHSDIVEQKGPWQAIKISISGNIVSQDIEKVYKNYELGNAKRNLPDMDYLMECNNRLWGCRYGLDSVSGDYVNEIFASKLGDPGNWHYFSNAAIDSYYVSLGKGGKFTGAVDYKGSPTFFREDCIHSIFGYYPANYQLRTITGYGVQNGSSKSCIVMNDICYYLSAVGVMAYSGDVPQSVAEPFGTELYHEGRAGTIGNKLYMSMLDTNNSPVLFCYDDAKAMWHKEDEMRAVDFCTFGNECYALRADDFRLIATGGVKGEEEAPFEWMMQSGNIGYTIPNRKRLNRLVLRMKLDLGGRADISVQYDSDGNWIHAFNIRPTGRTGSVMVPICPQRCDHFSIRIKGKGQFRLLNACRYYEIGSDTE